MTDDAHKMELFASLQYYEAGKMSAEAKEILDKAGAKRHSYMGELVKIAITETTDDEHEYSEICEIYDIPVVSSLWVIMSHRCGRQLPTKPFPPQSISTLLFREKVFCASQEVGKADMNSIWAMVTFYGGSVSRSLSDNVTHLICTSMNSIMYSSVAVSPNIHIVTPDWIAKCIESKNIVDESEYHPKLLVSSSSPALRRQLLSPLPPPPTDVKKKSVVNRSPSKQKAKTTPGFFQQPPVAPVGPGTPLTGCPPVSHINYPYASRPRAPKPKLHEMPSGFPGFQQEGSMPQMNQPMMGTPSRSPHRPQMPGQFVDPSFVHHPGYGMSAAGLGGLGHPGLNQPLPSAMHQGAQHGSRQFLKTTSPVSSAVDAMGFGPIHYTDATRHSPVPSSMPGMRPPLPSGQRSSPGTRKTPPMMNFGPMSEVPYPSQATLPEETPIIRMTNMAAFPMGSETAPVQRKSPIASGRSTPFKTPPPTTSPHRHQSKSPVNSQSANISVIKSVQQLPPSAESLPATPTSTTGGTKAGSGVSNTAGGDTAATVADIPAVYYGYDSNEAVPADMCLMGCIFYMGEYLKSDPCEDWIKAIEENGGTVDPSYSNRVTHVLVETQASDVCRLALNDCKRVVTAHWLNDVIGKNKMEPPWRAHHLPHPHVADKLLCADQVIGITGFDAEERRVIRVLVQMLGASFTTYLARSNTVLICKRMEGAKVTKAKEWGVECVNVQWLSELVLGNLRVLKLPIDPKYKVFLKPDDFLIDRHMAAVVMSGWRSPLKIPKDNCRKFKPSTKPTDSSWENKRKAEAELFINPSKRQRLQEIQNTRSNLPTGLKPQVLLTGFSPAEKLKYSEMVRHLGGLVCEDVPQCTHLIAEKVMRTPNFLLAVNYCSYISSSEWISESVKAGHFVDERVFTLQNSEAGSMWNILEALERRSVHGKPFNGLLFHITPGVPLSTSLPRKFLTDLIKAGGGSVQPSEEARWLPSKILESQATSHNNKPTYIVIGCRDDIHICVDLFHHNIDIYSVEFILSGVMNQSAAYESVLCVR